MDKAVIKYFEIPEEAERYIDKYLTKDEITAVCMMKNDVNSAPNLIRLLDGVVNNPEQWIKTAYSRAVLNKVEEKGEIKYQTATFYKRLAYFAQYEADTWAEIPKEDRKKMDWWYVKEYAQGAQPRLKEALEDSSKVIENAYFYTLEETLKMVDELNCEVYMVPCNCKSVALNCDKLKNVCLLLDKGINSEWDRGYGQVLSKEEAKEIIRMANKNGLMQTSEIGEAICNCDACCCYPIRASQLIGARGLWPKKVYDIIWNEEKCIHCGKCAKICNFAAFKKEEKTITFNKND